MDDRFDMPDFRKSDAPVRQSDGPVLIVRRVCLPAVLRGLELGEPVLLPSGLAEPVPEGGLEVHLRVGKGKAVHFFQVRVFSLVLGGRDSRELPSGPVSLYLVREHEVIDLAAAAEGLREHDALFSCWVQPVFDCPVRHVPCPASGCIGQRCQKERSQRSAGRSSATRTSRPGGPPLLEGILS